MTFRPELRVQKPKLEQLLLGDLLLMRLHLVYIPWKISAAVDKELE